MVDRLLNSVNHIHMIGLLAFEDLEDDEGRHCIPLYEISPGMRGSSLGTTLYGSLFTLRGLICLHMSSSLNPMLNLSQ